MQGVGSVASGRFMPSVPHYHQRKTSLDTEGVLKTQNKSQQIELSGAADLRRATLGALSDKATMLQTMLDALSSIQERTLSLRENVQRFLNLNKMSINASGLFAQRLVLSTQIEAFVAMMSEYLIQETINPASTNEDSPRMIEIDPDKLSLCLEEYDLTTPEGSEQFLLAIEGRQEALGNLQSYFKEQMLRLYKQSESLLQDMHGDLESDQTLTAGWAQGMAAVVSEQLLRGFDIPLLDVDGARQGSRIAKLLRNKATSPYGTV